MYHVPAGSHPDWAALEVLTDLLGDTPSGRLYKALVDSKKAAGIGVVPLELHDPGNPIGVRHVAPGAIPGRRARYSSEERRGPGQRRSHQRGSVSAQKRRY